MDSELHVKDGKVTAWVGYDATRLYRVKMLRSFIKLHRDSGMIPTRGVTITKMFAMAQEYTGQKYKRGEHSRAMEDLDVWIANMMAALPVKEV